MKIGLISDLHNRFGNKFPPIPEEIDILVCAGDMGEPQKIKERLLSFNIPFIYIAGNHEFYGNNYSDINRDIFNNMSGCYHNHTTYFMERKFHLSTLWSKIESPMDWLLYTSKLNDIRMIDGIVTHDKYREIVDESFKYIFDNVREGDIVVTHHSPSYLSCHEKWRGSDLNHCFHTELYDFIMDVKPSVWMHGHVHDSFDYMIGDTRIVCNPKGYPLENYGEYKVKVINVD